MENIDKVCEKVVCWIRNIVNESGAKGIIFGLSGGIDSAVMAGLAKRAFSDNSLGVIMPCHSHPVDEEHALLVANTLGLDTIKVDLTENYDVFMKSVRNNKENRLAEANVKPRLRMTTLYYLAQSKGYLVAGPSNKSELTVGYFTKYGDSGVDMLPLGSFVKSEIVELAKYLNIPKIIIKKPPTAGLWRNQTDEKEMGFTYEVLDRYIKIGEGKKEVIGKIQKMNSKSDHKRKYPPIFTL